MFPLPIKDSVRKNTCHCLLCSLFPLIWKLSSFFHCLLAICHTSFSIWSLLLSDFCPHCISGYAFLATIMKRNDYSFSEYHIFVHIYYLAIVGYVNFAHVEKVLSAFSTLVILFPFMLLRHL